MTPVVLPNEERVNRDLITRCRALPGVRSGTWVLHVHTADGSSSACGPYESKEEAYRVADEIMAGPPRLFDEAHVVVPSSVLIGQQVVDTLHAAIDVQGRAS